MRTEATEATKTVAEKCILGFERESATHREESGRGVTEFRGDGSSVQWRFGATAAQGKTAVQG
ncbi:uncharacterized protein DS421_19g651980 [Arachis hypogaea]|uniref:Uncharacterized protein n=1 Tax=Arachis hypogaea TaxID=3818 RepID=A0A6B9VAV3_ARAHY|nr:uncharacterized protein DS421_19g651980 [Arachis hypogaea]